MNVTVLMKRDNQTYYSQTAGRSPHTRTHTYVHTLSCCINFHCMAEHDNKLISCFKAWLPFRGQVRSTGLNMWTWSRPDCVCAVILKHILIFYFQVQFIWLATKSTKFKNLVYTLWLLHQFFMPTLYGGPGCTGQDKLIKKMPNVREWETQPNSETLCRNGSFLVVG